MSNLRGRMRQPWRLFFSFLSVCILSAPFRSDLLAARHLHADFIVSGRRQTGKTSSSKSHHPDVVWLMSFPNSGTSYTLGNTRKVSSIEVGTNYAAEFKGDSYEIIPTANSPTDAAGPFRHCCRDESKACPYKCPEDGYVLTKTHCIAFGNANWMDSNEGFLKDCRTATTDDVTGELYSFDIVKKAVHLIRDPFDNIVARFHLKNRHKSRHYEKTPDGFRSYCFERSDHDQKYQKLWKQHIGISNDVLTLLNNVPCYADFLRYVTWHNRAIEVIANAKIPSHILHYESYAIDWKSTVSKLLGFLEQPFPEGNEGKPFRLGKTYRHYFTSEEIQKLRQAFALYASEATWSSIKHYFVNMTSTNESTR